MTWLTHTDKMYRTRKCVETVKVDYATNLLIVVAYFGREMISSTLGEKLAAILTWEQFKVNLYENYCSQTTVRQLEQEFSQFMQGEKSV